MSTHGRDGVGRLSSGSVTEEVLRLSPVPLLMSNELSVSAAATVSRNCAAS